MAYDVREADEDSVLGTSRTICLAKRQKHFSKWQPAENQSRAPLEKSLRLNIRMRNVDSA